MQVVSFCLGWEGKWVRLVNWSVVVPGRPPWDLAVEYTADTIVTRACKVLGGKSFRISANSREMAGEKLGERRLWPPMNADERG